MPTAFGWRARALDLALLLLVYGWIRWLVLDTAFDEVGLWMYELYPMGTMAELYRRGVEIPLAFYYDNAAGQIFAGLATIPIFELFGPSYLSLKLLPMLMGAGLLAAAHALLWTWFGRWPALLGGLLFALPPTLVFKYSITCSGNHFENLFFSMLAVLLFFQAHRRGLRRGWLVATGAAMGFALFIFLGALLTIAMLGLLHLGMRGWRAALGDALPLAGGALLGLSPLIALNLSTQGRGLSFLEAKFAAENAPSPIDTAAWSERAAHYLFEKLPMAPNMPGHWGLSGTFWDQWVTLTLWIAAAACCLVGWRPLWQLVRAVVGGAPRLEPRQALLLLLVLYLPLSTLAFAVSNFRIGGYGGILGYGGYRYYLPWFSYSLLASGVLLGLAWLSQRWLWRGLALLLFAGLLLPGLANLALVRADAPVRGLGRAYPGYDLPKIARALIAGRNALSRAEQIRYLDSFPQSLRAPVVRAIGYNLGVLQIERNLQAEPGAPWWIDLEQLSADWPAADAEELARGAGIGARFQQVVGGADIGTLLPHLERTLQRASPRTRELLPCFAEGLGSVNPTLPLLDQTERVTVATNGLIGALVSTGADPLWVRGVARGQGLLLGQLWARGIAADANRASQRYQELFPDLHVDFARGMGQGIAAGGQQLNAPAFFASETEREAFRQGAAEMRARLQVP